MGHNFRHYYKFGGIMIKDVEGLLSKVCVEIKERCEVAVVGLSGGADSTLVALLCRRALGPQNVYGVHMPAHDDDHNGVNFNARSYKLAFHLRIKEINAPVMEIVTAINQAVFQAVRPFNPLGDISQVNSGNSRSRARMCVLYGISHHLNEQGLGRVRVVGTGNMSEDFIGYDTKGGDALCDFFPIGELFKSEVYQLLDHFKEQKEILEEHIDRVPSAGLWSGQTDEKELGYSYAGMEPAIKKIQEHVKRTGHLSTFLPEKAIEDFVFHRHVNNKHKHEAPPVIALGEFRE